MRSCTSFLDITLSNNVCSFQVDSTADYLVLEDRVNLDYPAPFGRDATPEEAKIAELDGKTGASLKVGQKCF